MSSSLSQPSALTTGPPAAYTIVTRGVTFTLSRSQIEFDSPNYFTSGFLGDFAEAETKTIYLDREPKLFALIVDHLSGYRVLPLAEQSIPRTMTKEAALENLKTDAEYFGLAGLLAKLDTPTAPTRPESKYYQDLEEYLRYCGMSVYTVPKVYSQLYGHGFYSSHPFRNNHDTITLEFLTKTIGLLPGVALSILSRREDGEEAWEAHCRALDERDVERRAKQ